MTRSRRDFLRDIGCGALTATAILTGARDLFVMNALAGASGPTDYKALVCIFLFGGNDANNTVVPVDGYADYAAARRALTIPQAQLLPIGVPSERATFGLHPSLVDCRACGKRTDWPSSRTWDPRGPAHPGPVPDQRRTEALPAFFSRRSANRVAKRLCDGADSDGLGWSPGRCGPGIDEWIFPNIGRFSTPNLGFMIG
jgi:hypothetical protein